MALTTTQKQTLAAALRAETDPTIAGPTGALAIRNDVAIAAWCNGAHPSQKAWKAIASRRDLFEAMQVTKFDGITQGKRDAYVVMMDNTPIDFGRNAMRSAVVDVWGNTDSVAVLTALTESATRGEVYIGGTSKTTNTVAALDRAALGPYDLNEISDALNRF
jgi:hypothetical protein